MEELYFESVYNTRIWKLAVQGWMHICNIYSQLNKYQHQF